jgi:tRNA A-37 threonylcarbamoyl transferase component Bud32
MSASDSESSTKDRRVNEIVADYLRSIERGELPDRAALIAGHVDLANELTAFFADHDRFWRAAAPLADALTLPPCESPEPGPRHTVRYFGDYELLEEIARGGMGVVYKARQISLNRPVALKMILAGELATPEARQRFRAEAEAAANLQHPNIVAIHEVGEHEGKQYFSMDFVVGKNLAEIVRGNPLPAERAASYVKTISEAIHFAHQRGTLHRDLKPQNVLIDADDRPRITDFGLAKRVDADSGLTRTGDVLGSPSYMPPEQAASQSAEIGPHSDVYSLGAILYELLTGRPPFAAATPWETICQVLQTPAVSPRKLNPDVPRDLETICLKCLEKQPQRRYHSARELAEELGRFLNHEPIHARPISLARRATFWARRHPWVITGVASLFVIGLVLVSFGLWEETRYLIWLQTHPDYVRAPGPHIERLEIADAFAPWFFFLTFLVLLSRHPWAKRSLWQRREPFADLVSPPQPLSGRKKLALALLGGIGTICGFIVLAMIAQAYVWEGRRVAGDLSLIYLLFWSSISALLAVARDVKGNAYGSSARALSPEDENAIREAVIAGEMIGAIKMYRDAVGASLPEAKAYVGRVVREHEDKHPGELAVKVFARTRVQPKRLIVGLLVEASILGAMLWLLPAPERPRWLVEFIVSCSLGLAFIVAMRRFAGFGRPLVFAAPWPILMVAEVMSRVLYPEHYTFGAFMSGFGAGVLLFVSAIARMPIAQPTAASEASEKRGRM